MKAAFLIFCALFPVLHASAATFTHSPIVCRPPAKTYFYAVEVDGK
jgi:hypothetical protein